MSLLRGFAGVFLVAVAGGLAVGAVYGSKDGLLMGVFLLAGGLLVVTAVHLLARGRHAAGSLDRQFAAGVCVSVGLVVLAVLCVALLMFISAHDAYTMGVLLVAAGVLIAYSVRVLAGGVMTDIEMVRDGLRAVGDGRRDLVLRTGGRDELAQLADSANLMTAQLAASEAERDAAEGARRDLVAAVSHDLRTPLTSLRLLVDAIEDDVVDPADRRRYLEQMSFHLRSLSGLIDDLFELSRIEAGDIEWSMQQVRLDELVEESVEAMRAQAVAKRIRVATHVPDGLATPRANPEKLQRVLFNLIQNAIRHTPADGSVTIRAEATGDVVEVEVSDTGEGLHAHEREQAFEPFYREGKESARTGDGSGLGLTICRAIVEAHGGQIWFADSPTGARVRFSLPGVP